METRSRIVIGATVISACAAVSVLATTWVPKDVVCPLCGTTNKLQEIASFGGYIYGWPSKFQQIFWPATESEAFYSCRSCRLTCLMSDFVELPKDKFDAVKKQLADVSFDREYDDYTKIPMSQKLAVAERVYSVLDKDDRFQCWFQRVKGYHLEKEARTETGEVDEAKQKLADDARRKAIELADKMMKDEGNAGLQKELLLIRGAMKHFLKDDTGALADFTKAVDMKYTNKKMDPKRAESIDENLTSLLKEYVELIKNPQKAIKANVD